jgi:hypothetical protein
MKMMKSKSFVIRLLNLSVFATTAMFPLVSHCSDAQVLECQIYDGNDSTGELQETLTAYAEVDLGTHFTISHNIIYSGQEFHFGTFFRKGLRNSVQISSGGYGAWGWAQAVDGPAEVTMTPPNGPWIRFKCALVPWH